MVDWPMVDWSRARRGGEVHRYEFDEVCRYQFEEVHRYEFDEVHRYEFDEVCRYEFDEVQKYWFDEVHKSQQREESRMTSVSQTLMDEKAIARTLRRMASEIVERNEGTDDLCFVGIRTRGVVLANRLQELVRQKEDVLLPLGVVDITLYRDDAIHGLPDPEVGPTRLDFSIRDKKVVLVDDVLYTGRTVRAALDELMDFGRPKKVELAVLVDRGWRELPIQADYVGISLDTKLDQRVRVLLTDPDGREEVVVLALTEELDGATEELDGATEELDGATEELDGATEELDGATEEPNKGVRKS